MKPLLASAMLVAVATAVPAAAAGPAVPVPSGTCDNPADVLCRNTPCGPDDLDCGMILPCVVYLLGTCYN